MTWPLLWENEELKGTFEGVLWGSCPEFVYWASLSQRDASTAFSQEDNQFALACCQDAQRCLFLAFVSLLQELNR